MLIPIYVVSRLGMDEYESTSLTKCLRHIGAQVSGNRMGALLVTVAEALKDGYSIRAC